MVTYEMMSMLFQFGIFLLTGLSVVIAIISMTSHKKKK
ncbi:putative holin-like toxin [Pallidibacillus thermolactis]|nr:putative holin-like toxin [Pallidibacillus thermolactis subsp. kokeshiiformis]